MATTMRKESGSCSASATRTNRTDIANCIASTKKRFVLYMSRKAAQRGFSDQAMPMLAVASVISPSEWPRSLNIVPATQMTIANGMPSAKYELGTQVAGCATRPGCVMSSSLDGARGASRHASGSARRTSAPSVS
jgi:hypothetical protein